VVIGSSSRGEDAVFGSRICRAASDGVRRIVINFMLLDCERLGNLASEISIFLGYEGNFSDGISLPHYMFCMAFSHMVESDALSANG